MSLACLHMQCLHGVVSMSLRYSSIPILYMRHSLDGCVQMLEKPTTTNHHETLNRKPLVHRCRQILALTLDVAMGS